ncbi:MAG: penicillin-binding protein activator [Candidatus Puniceispirillales bacterium]
MLKKKLNIFKLLLLSLLIVSCNNKRDNEKLEIFETKPPNKENDLIPQNILQRTASSFKLDEEIKSDKNLSQESKISQNSKLDLEVDKNIINTLQNKNLTSAPIIGKKKLLKLQNKTSIVENFDNTSNFNIKKEFTIDMPSIDLDVIKKIDRQNEKAIDAAIEMLSKNSVINKPQKVKDKRSNEEIKNKKEIKFSAETYKVAVIVPLTGKHQRIGQQIMMGVENAYFSNFNKNIEIKFFDTTELSNEFFDFLKRQELDLIIGPVFSNKIIEINNIVKNINVPILSFSNNKRLNYKNVWLLGKIQEDEISSIIDFGIKTGIKNFAIFGDSTQYSKTLIKTAQNELYKKGISNNIFEIKKEILNDRNKLRDEIKKISGWKKENNKKLILPNPKYDGILFTGSKSFILKVSPLLTYYDLGAERVTYLGNSQFNNEELIEELSLQGSFFSSNEELTKTNFIKTWEKKWGFKPSFLNTLANDLTNFANKLHLQQSTLSYITREKGHDWISGKIFITNDGYNKRNQIINKIENKSLTKIYLE